MFKIAEPLIVDAKDDCGGIEVIPSEMKTVNEDVPTASSTNKGSSFSMLSFLVGTLLSIGVFSIFSENSFDSPIDFKMEVTDLLTEIKTVEFSSLINNTIDDPKKMYSVIGITSILTTMIYLCMPINRSLEDSKLKNVVETAWALFLLGMIAVGVKLSLF